MALACSGGVVALLASCSASLISLSAALWPVYFMLPQPNLRKFAMTMFMDMRYGGAHEPADDERHVSFIDNIFHYFIPFFDMILLFSQPSIQFL